MSQLNLTDTERRIAQKWYVIFALDQGTNALRVNQFVNYMLSHDAGYKVLQGCYHGEFERSYIVSQQTYESVIRGKGWADAQETVLELGPADRLNHRVAFLRRVVDDHYLHLGKFRAVPRHIAVASGSWTYDLESKEYFTTEYEDGGSAAWTSSKQPE